MVPPQGTDCAGGEDRKSSCLLSSLQCYRLNILSPQPGHEVLKCSVLFCWNSFFSWADSNVLHWLLPASLSQEIWVAPAAAAEAALDGQRSQALHSPPLLGNNRVIYEWVGVCILLSTAPSSHRKKRLFWLSCGEGGKGAWLGSPHHFQEEGKASKAQFCHQCSSKKGRFQSEPMWERKLLQGLLTKPSMFSWGSLLLAAAGCGCTQQLEQP